MLAPVIKSLEDGHSPEPALVAKLSKDDGLRTTLYQILEHHQQLEIFPEEYKNRLSEARSGLVYWLLHPNELGARPDHIEFIQTVNRTEKLITSGHSETYYIFKFKMNDQHHSKKGDWFIGLSGPYSEHSPPYQLTPGTFSTFEKFESKTVEQHVEWIEIMLGKKGVR